jgi:hypothetical protein
VFSLVAPRAGVAAWPKGRVSVTLAPPGKPLRPGDRLVLRATLKNISGRSMTFPTSPGLVPSDSSWYEVHVTDAHARPAPPSARVVKLRRREEEAKKEGRPAFGRWSSNISRTLRPGQSLAEEIDVTRYYDLSRPGAYAIWVVRPLPVGVPAWAAKKYWKGSVRSNTITVTVVK